MKYDVVDISTEVHVLAPMLLWKRRNCQPFSSTAQQERATLQRQKGTKEQLSAVGAVYATDPWESAIALQAILGWHAEQENLVIV